MPIKREQIYKDKKKQPIVIVLVIIVGVLAGLFFYSNWQTTRIKTMLNESAYRNMEKTLTNLGNMVSNVFAQDQQELQILASGCSNIENIEEYVKTLEYNTDINGIYYGKKNSTIAVGKDEKTIELDKYEFVEHENGQVRSKSYITNTASYAYIVREPVKKNGRIEGYLYVEYLMQRFSHLMPRESIDGNDYSILDSEQLKYVYIPSGSTAGAHINFRMLKSYLQNPDENDAIMQELEYTLKEHQYYMKMLEFKNVYDITHPTTYVMFLWPIDDGEYYLSGFIKIDSLQSERIDVEETIQILFRLVIGASVIILSLLMIFFSNSLRVSKNKALIQKQHNEELSEALHIARAANESKSNFLSNMSHDIRTPMNAIIGFTTLLSKESKDSKAIEYADKILGASNYLLSLINDILDMSKIESGKTTLSISDFKISELINDINTLVQTQADEKNQTLITTIVNIEHDYVMGDELRVRQVLMNILSNAVKYTPNGGKINFNIIGVPQKKQKYQKFNIIVEDNGYGISKENLSTIFEPFTRVNNTTTSRIQGTGLGLAIVKNIVDLMGGTIQVQSELSQGSTFTVELELPISEKEERLVEQNEVIRLEQEDFSLEGLHILAAEDNELNAEILVELLDMEGASCKVCEDGIEVVEEFEHSKPDTYDLILMDIQMPRQNGYEATKAIRAGNHLEASTIPIIAMTANAFAEDVKEALQSGMNAHIAKPINMDVLEGTLMKLQIIQKKEKKK